MLSLWGWEYNIIQSIEELDKEVSVVWANCDMVGPPPETFYFFYIDTFSWFWIHIRLKYSLEEETTMLLQNNAVKYCLLVHIHVAYVSDVVCCSLIPIYSLPQFYLYLVHN